MAVNESHATEVPSHYRRAPTANRFGDFIARNLPSWSAGRLSPRASLRISAPISVRVLLGFPQPGSSPVARSTIAERTPISQANSTAMSLSALISDDPTLAASHRFANSEMDRSARSTRLINPRALEPKALAPSAEKGVASAFTNSSPSVSRASALDSILSITRAISSSN
jgi:hypothetical protein